MIVCCGEALIDMLPRKSTDGSAVYQPFNGGSIFNTAIALGRLGMPVAFFTGISTDFFGDSLKQGLNESGVDLGYVRFSTRPSTLAFVKFDNGHARYSIFDENSAGRMLTKKDLPKLAPRVAALHFGSFSLATEPCASAYEALMKREAKTRVISLDPNIRPTLIKDRRAHLARLKRLIALSDILKISDEDVAWMTGKRNLAAAAKTWLKAGPKIVCITKGGEGLEAFTKRYAVSISAVPVKVADTVGAGDTFTAGLLAALSNARRLTKPALAAIAEPDLTAALEFAARAAAITVSRPGADPPWAHEIPEA